MSDFITSAHPAQLEEEGREIHLDPDRFILEAKLAVIESLDKFTLENIDFGQVDVDDLYIMWFATILKNWKAMVRSSSIYRVAWIVSYNEYKREAYVEVYVKKKNIVVRSRREE